MEQIMDVTRAIASGYRDTEVANRLGSTSKRPRLLVDDQHLLSQVPLSTSIAELEHVLLLLSGSISVALHDHRVVLVTATSHQ